MKTNIMRRITKNNHYSLLGLLFVISILALGCDKPMSMGMIGSTNHCAGAGGSSESKTSSLGRLSLTQYIENNKIEEALKLLEAGEVDPNAADDPNWPPLSLAAQKGSLELVQALVAKGADIHHQVYGNNALTEAIEAGHQGVARYLIDQGADPYVTDYYGKNLLMRACKNYCIDADQLNTIRRWIELGLELNFQNPGYVIEEDPDRVIRGRGITALMYAAEERQEGSAILPIDVTNLLLENGADPTLLDAQGHDAAWHASEYGEATVAERLRER